MRYTRSTKRFHRTADVIHLYKAQILSYSEYRTTGIYHARKELLSPVDNVQRRLLRDIGVSEEDALLHFGLAPLEARRDMAMLGMIHRAVLRKGPRQLQQLLHKKGNRRVTVPKSTSGLHLVKRSVFGLAPVYNGLPADIRGADEVKGFQKASQELLKSKIARSDWCQEYSPR